MLKLTNTTDAQTFAVTTRDFASSTDATLIYKREGKEVETSVNVSLTKAGYFVNATAALTGLVEDAVYTFKITDNNTTLHKGEFFVSSQSVDAYSVNNNEYTTNTTTNDYIIFE